MLNIVRTAVIVFTLLHAPSCAAGQSNSEFSNYWHDFRFAVLNDDYEKLEKLIKLPLEVKGVVDFIPAQYFEADQLPGIFEKLLSQTQIIHEGGGLVEVSVKEIVEREIQINKNPNVAGVISISQFDFERVEGEWRLVRAYLED